MSGKQLFEKFDKNNDGKLSLEEFSEVALAFDKSTTQEDIVKMFKEIDVNGDGHVEANEFVSWVQKMLKEVFVLCDDDGDEKISRNELYVAMTALGIECTMESVTGEVQVNDADGDGYLNFDEFMAMLTDALI